MSAEKLVVFFCTHCGVKIKASPSRAGKTCPCPKCKAAVIVPGLALPTSTPPPPLLTWDFLEEPPPSPNTPADVTSDPPAWAYGVAITLVVGLLALIVFAVVQPSKESKTPKPQVDAPRATVKFTGTEFIIRNDNTYPWEDVTIMVNPGTFNHGYYVEVPRLDSGAVYSVGAMQFATSSGERFNPYQMKAREMNIRVKMPDGGSDLWVGGWK